MERLLAFIPAKSGMILDVACGKGATTAHLLRHYATACVVGVNIAEDQLAAARVNAPQCGLARMNAVALGFRDRTFDNVICVEAAFHFDTREQFLREARRVLKPGGRVVLSDILLTREGERSRPHRTERNFVPDLDAYRDVYRRAGFCDVAVEDATRACWRGHYWSVVNYVHERYLCGAIGYDELKAYLESTYRRVGELRHYVLVSARREAEGG